MPKREVAQCVIVRREGKALKLMPGDSFDFTADELKDIKEANPDALVAPKESAPEREVKMPGSGKAAPKGSAPATEGEDL